MTKDEKAEIRQRMAAQWVENRKIANGDRFPPVRWEDVFAAFIAGAQSGWVKVEDGLPEIYTTCLTFSHNEIIMSIYLNDGVWEDEQTALIHDVTHWMLLPSKPIV